MRKFNPGGVSTWPLVKPFVVYEFVYMTKSPPGVSSTRLVQPGENYAPGENCM